jgi:maleate isomerase
MVSRLSLRTGIPVAATCASAVVAVRVLGVERIAVVSPPWFDDEVNRLGAAHFRSQDVQVVSAVSADLPQDPRRIQTAAVIEWTSRRTRPMTGKRSGLEGTAFERREQSSRW